MDTVGRTIFRRGPMATSWYVYRRRGWLEWARFSGPWPDQGSAKSVIDQNMANPFFANYSWRLVERRSRDIVIGYSESTASHDVEIVDTVIDEFKSQAILESPLEAGQPRSA